jgi:hypothetical protein
MDSLLISNASQPLWKHKPPPCTLFYLAGDCGRGADCKNAHDYLLEDEHIKIIREAAKKVPCVAINNSL